MHTQEYIPICIRVGLNAHTGQESSQNSFSCKGSGRFGSGPAAVSHHWEAKYLAQVAVYQSNSMSFSKLNVFCVSSTLLLNLHFWLERCQFLSPDAPRSSFGSPGRRDTQDPPPNVSWVLPNISQMHPRCFQRSPRCFPAPPLSPMRHGCLPPGAPRESTFSYFGART